MAILIKVLIGSSFLLMTGFQSMHLATDNILIWSQMLLKNKKSV